MDVKLGIKILTHFLDKKILAPYSQDNNLCLNISLCLFWTAAKHNFKQGSLANLRFNLLPFC